MNNLSIIGVFPLTEEEQMEINGGIVFCLTTALCIAGYSIACVALGFAIGSRIWE